MIVDAPALVGPYFCWPARTLSAPETTGCSPGKEERQFSVTGQSLMKTALTGTLAPFTMFQQLVHACLTGVSTDSLVGVLRMGKKRPNL